MDNNKSTGAKNGFLSESNRVLIAQLWVTSVAGSGLVLILQSLGSDWPNWRWHWLWQLKDIEWGFTADRFLRYALAAWFAAHLTIAYVVNEMLKDGGNRSLGYDVVQSIAGFGALASLGFVTQNFGAALLAPHYAFSITFGAIALIGGLAWLHNLRDTTQAKPQRARAVATIVGLIWTVITVVAGPQNSDASVRWWIVVAGVIFCWGALIWYWLTRKIELKVVDTSSKPLTLSQVEAAIREANQNAVQKGDLKSRVEELLKEKKVAWIKEVLDSLPKNPPSAPPKQ